MTISATTLRNQYTGDGSTVDFNITFSLTSKTEAKVYLKEISTGIYTEKTEVTHFNFDANPPTKITFLTAPSSLYQVHIVRSNPLTQTTDYLNTGPFLAETHEGALDKMTKLMQELDDRALKKEPYDEFSGAIPVRLADKILATDSGKNFEWISKSTFTRTVSVKYKCLQALSLSNAIPNGIDFETEVHNIGNSTVTTGALWTFTVGVGDGGLFRISTFLRCSGASGWAVGESFRAHVTVNGNIVGYLFWAEGKSGSFGAGEPGSLETILADEDEVQIVVTQFNGTTLTLSGDGDSNWVSITRIGDSA